MKKILIPTLALTFGLLSFIPMGIVSAQSFDTVLSWMYTNGLTKFNTTTDFRPNDLITRGEASKFVDSAAGVMGLTKNFNQCTFDDISGYDYTLIPHIGNACAYGLLKGSNGIFMPNNTLTEAQAITIVMRSVMGFLDETGPRRWSAYYEAGVQAGIITTETLDGVNNTNVTRAKLGTWFYKAATLSGAQEASLDGEAELQALIQEIFGE